MQVLQKNSSVNGIAAGKILYCVAKPVYVDRDYVYQKKEKEMLFPFLPRIQKVLQVDTNALIRRRD